MIYILAGQEIDCYECNSWEDQRCNDTFLHTAHAADMPVMIKCEGCCVKLVTDMGTGKSS